MQTLVNETLLSEAEAASLLGVEISTLRTNAARRKGPPRIKAGRMVLYRQAAVLDWLRRNEVDPEAARRRAAGE